MKKRLLSFVLVLTISCTFIPVIVAQAANIKIGDYLQMGTYYGEPILWRCVAFEKITGYDDCGNPIIDSTDTVTEYKQGYLPLILSDRIICIKPFDASANTNNNSSHFRGYNYREKKIYGSNYWGDSNMRSWLNSNNDAGEVKWLCGNPPTKEGVWKGYNAYAEEAGFLTNFTKREQNIINKVTQKSLLHKYEFNNNIINYHIYKENLEDVVQNYSTAYSEMIEDKIFLLDIQQVYNLYQNRDILGKYYLGIPTNTALDNSEYNTVNDERQGNLSAKNGDYWYYWLRSPHADYSVGYATRAMSPDGTVFSFCGNYYNSNIGVRPAFYLSENPSFIGGNGVKTNPYIVDNSVRVHKTDTNNIAYNVESELNSLLSSVTLCDTTIKGPTFDIAGYNICPLEFGAKAVLDFSGLSKNITIDKDNKKVHVILGKLNKNGSASVVQTTDMCDASWSKQYNEIKDLYKSMTGFNASGSDRNGINNWNKFEKMKAELNHMNCDMFISASMDCVAYLDFDYHTGYLQLSEGGFIESASLGTNFKYPLIGSCLYATLGLKGSETGTIKATLTSSGTINPQMSIKPSITAKASITGEIPFLCKAEGGVDATLAVLLQTFDPKLTVTMNGNIFLNASVLNKTLVDWSKPYLNVELYPEFKTLSLMSLYNNYKDTYDNAVSMPRDYLNTISLFSLGVGNTLYNQNCVYPYNDAQLVRLPGNAMMLLWTGDDGTKSDINRTSLMYSIYKNGIWSETQKIAEDGTATGSFKAVSNGEKVYIVYQKLSQVLDDNTSVDDMLAAADLYVVKYENGAFSLPICLNNYDNTAYESIGGINLNGDNLTVAWIENSVNDIFLSEGTSYVKTRSIVNDTMSSVNTISALSAADNQYPGDVHIADDTIYYAAYDASVEETTADLYTYSNEVSEKLLDTDKIYNIKNIDNTLYYIKNSSIYKLENSTEIELGFDNITSFEIVSNGNYCSMLMSVCGGAKNEIYISNLINGEWSHAERFTDLGKYIRSYSPFMYADGTINLAVSAAEVNDNIEEGESVYGDTSIMVLNQCDYCDISTSYVYYEEDEIQPNSDMSLYFDVNNDSANSLNSVKVKLTDKNGNKLDEQTVECSIAPFSTEKLNIKYHLPKNIGQTQLNLTVSIDGEEKDYSNNTATTEFGYTNLSVSPIECTVNKNNTASLKSTILNTGFEDAENVIVKVYNGNINSDVLDEINIGTMTIGETYEFEYTFPEELMVSPDIDIMNAVYIQAETSSVESLYSDNEQKIAFDSYNGEPVTSPTTEPTETPTTSPTATPIVKPTITPTVEPTTSPSPSSTAIPTATPTIAPTSTPEITVSPSPTATAMPTATPTGLPTTSPTATPTIKPTEKPKETDTPTTTPIEIPTAKPTDKPQETEKPTITLKTMLFEIQNAAVNDKVTANIANVSDTAQSGILIFAAYSNDGKLISVKSQNIDNIAASDTLPCEFDIPEGAEKYRLLIWSSWKHIIPLAESVEVK